MYGRVFEGMFTGSMRGSGALVFAVWTYVITTMREDKEVGVQVELRPKNLEFYLGESEKDIAGAIEYLCQPDPDSTCQEEQGRRLVPVGKFVYRVVSGAAYMKIRTEEDLREYRRLAKREERAKKKQAKKGPPLKGETASMKAEQNGDQAGADRIAEGSLPERASGVSGLKRSGGEQPASSTLPGPGVPEPPTVFEPGEQIGLPPGPEFQE